MNNRFYKPYIENKVSYFPYTREQLCERPIFPTYVFDTGAFQAVNDILGTANSDELLPRIMDGSLFDYWQYDGKFDWCAVYKKFSDVYYTPEWEGHIFLNRLYILLPLAQQYMKTGDKKYADKWFELLSDWNKNVPYGHENYGDRPDLTWTDMQVAWRTINMIHSIFMFGDEKALSKEQWDYVYALIKPHIEQLYTEGLTFREDNLHNHHLQIGMVLIMVGTLLPEIGRGEEYVALGRKIVEMNLYTVMYEDGVSSENSQSYGHFIARLYTEAALLLKYNGYPEIKGLDECIKKQYDYLYQFAAPNGRSLLIGDAYSLDAAADIEFVSRVYPLELDTKKRTHLFPVGRMAVLRNSKFELFVDAMNPDPTKLRNPGYGQHQHWGRPSFILYSAEGEALLLDSGTVNYDRRDLRCQFNGVTAHNVIACDDMPLEDGYLRPTEVRQQLEVTAFESTDLVKRFEVTGTIKEPGGKNYTWVREFVLTENELTVTDTVKASEPMHFHAYLHFAYPRTGYFDRRAKLQPVENDGKRINLRVDRRVFTVDTDTPAKLSFTPIMTEYNQKDFCQMTDREIFSDEFTEHTVIKLN